MSICVRCGSGTCAGCDSPSTETGATTFEARKTERRIEDRMYPGGFDVYEFRPVDQETWISNPVHDAVAALITRPSTAPEVEVREQIRELLWQYLLRMVRTDAHEAKMEEAMDALTRLIDDRVEAEYMRGWNDHCEVVGDTLRQLESRS